MMAGFREALKGDYTWFGEMDADQSHQPEELPALREAIPACGHGRRRSIPARRRDPRVAPPTADLEPYLERDYRGTFGVPMGTSPTAIACTVGGRWRS